MPLCLSIEATFMKRIKSFEKKTLSLNSLSFIGLFILLSILWSLFYVLILFTIGIKSNNVNPSVNLSKYFFKAVVFAPLIETFIFQFILIEFLKLFNLRKNLIILSSGLIFGILHYFNESLFREFAFATILGLIFAYSYILLSKKNSLNSFIGVVIIHAGYNFFVFVLKFISQM